MYDFDKLTNRFNTNSYKWDIKSNELPMWVADMDFEAPECVINYLNKRIDNKVFGYNIIPNDWYNAYISWWKNNHGFKIDKEWLMFSTGVVPTISSVVRRITKPGEKILIQTPVYNIFFNSIINNGRFIKESPLNYKNGEYQIDFDRLEKDLSDPLVTMMILCNPHNPVGKIWTKKELAKIGSLCKKHNVVVLSDEIHCDITRPKMEYVPFGSVNDECLDNSIICIAPTKCFNLAGMQSSAIVVKNPKLRFQVYRGINNDEIAEPNTFACGIAIAAFNEGKPWLNEMNKYVFENRKIAENYISENIKELKVIKGDCTYLMWIDCSKITNNSEFFCKFLREKTGLILSDGLEYGEPGRLFVRMNLATQKQRVLDGLERLKKGVELCLK